MKTLNQQFGYSTPSTVLKTRLFLAAMILSTSVLGGTQLMAETINTSQSDSYSAAVAASGSCVCVPPPSGMVDWWPFDEPGSSSPFTADIAGFANDGNVFGATYTPGVVGDALCFDGVDNYVEVGNHPEVNFLGDCTVDVPDEFTIDAWVRTMNDIGVTPILDKRVEPSGPIGYYLYLYDGRLGFQMANGTHENYISPSPNVADGQWHFIAVTVQRLCSRITGVVLVGHLYVDGVQVFTFVPKSGDISNDAPLLIGKLQPEFGQSYFHGCIDELEIFNLALSETEIDSIYLAGVSGKRPIWWPCGPGEQVWTSTSGLVDDYSLTPDPAPTPSFGFSYRLNYRPNRGYDNDVNDMVFFHTFTMLPSQINRAWLVLGMRPVSVPATPDNDKVYLYFTDSSSNNLGSPIVGTTEWAAYIGADQGSPHILPPQEIWIHTDYPNREIIPLDLSSLPGGTDLIPSLNTAGFLDVEVQDDTDIDFVELRVCYKPCVPPPSCMVAWWPLDETSGWTVADIVGGYNGTAMPGSIGSLFGPGPVTTTLFSLGVFSQAMVGNALFFYPLQANRRVEVPSNPALDPGPDGDFTIDAWVVYQDCGLVAASNKTIVKKKGNPPSAGWQLIIRPDVPCGSSKLRFDICNVSPEVDITPGWWHHVAATLKRGSPNPPVTPDEISLYVDGVAQIFPFALGPYVASTANLQIGGAGNGQMTIDEVEIFNCALSEAEIDLIHDANSAGKCDQCVPPPCGIVAWWPFDDTPYYMITTTAQDIVGGRDGTTRTGAINTLDSPISVAGMVDNAFAFDGTSAYVEVLCGGDLSFGYPTDNFTIDAWIKVEPGDESGIRPIVDKRVEVYGAVFGYQFFLYNGYLGFHLADGGWTNYMSTENVANGAWRHVAVTVQRTGTPRVTLYVDGLPKIPSGTPRQGNAFNVAPLLIGRGRPIDISTTPYFKGAIDELEIFSRALTQPEIQAIFHARSAGKCKAKICVSKFNDLNWNGVKDLGEPPLFGWTFDIEDSLGNLIGSVTTDGEAPACRTVPAPGTYKITEQGQPGWQSTTPNPQTVTVQPDEPDEVNLVFGNWNPNWIPDY